MVCFSSGKRLADMVLITLIKALDPEASFSSFWISLMGKKETRVVATMQGKCARNLMIPHTTLLCFCFLI